MARPRGRDRLVTTGPYGASDASVGTESAHTGAVAGVARIATLAIARIHRTPARRRVRLTDDVAQTDGDRMHSPLSQESRNPLLVPEPARNGRRYSLTGIY